MYIVIRAQFTSIYSQRVQCILVFLGGSDGCRFTYFSSDREKKIHDRRAEKFEYKNLDQLFYLQLFNYASHHETNFYRSSSGPGGRS